MKQKELTKGLKEGRIFIYPGNEAYEIICNSEARESVERILDAKIEGITALIASDKKWIYDNFEAKKSYVERLPGPFTYVLKAKNKNKIPKHAINGNIAAIRMPENQITKAVAKDKIILFSCMLKKKGKFLIDPNALPREAKRLADFLIDGGILNSKPHAVIDLRSKVASLVN
ncbi:Sua5/YciO/YrdC/YwlC family protein [Candidatus Woesearchaeota archaeon]|nr:Sua5/YciO/YrdC/YwlC family protein [Candidatus Woesearchaeota archaeon]